MSNQNQQPSRLHEKPCGVDGCRTCYPNWYDELKDVHDRKCPYPHQNQQPCPTCRGLGHYGSIEEGYIGNTCPDCRGSGKAKSDPTFNKLLERDYTETIRLLGEESEAKGVSEDSKPQGRDFEAEAAEIEKLHTEHDYQCSWCGAKPEPKEPTKSFEDELRALLEKKMIWNVEAMLAAITSAHRTEVEQIIGEDEAEVVPEGFTGETGGLEVAKIQRRNQLRAEQRAKL